jgi:hypothetical protein
MVGRVAICSAPCATTARGQVRRSSVVMRSRSEINVLICCASLSALVSNPTVFHFRAPMICFGTLEDTSAPCVNGIAKSSPVRRTRVKSRLSAVHPDDER